MDFNNWYKKKIESSDLNPPEIIWENIQDELDIDHSWYHIKHHLDTKEKSRKQILFALAAIALVLILAGAYWFTVLQNGSSNIQLISSNEIINEQTRENSTNKNTKPANSSIQNNYQEAENNYTAVVSKTKSQSQLQSLSNNESLGLEKRTNETMLALLDVRINYNNPSTDRILEVKTIKIDSTNLEDQESKKAFHDLYIGATGQFANTWMLNEKTINGLNGSDLTKTNASFGYNLGFFMGTNITNTLNIQFDLDILVNNSQGYNEYINGHYVSNQMRLNYTQANLSFRYSKLSKRFINGEHGIILGGYLGYLRNANQYIEDVSTSIYQSYNNLDYGLFLGYEYIIPIYKKIGIGTGFRAYYGLQNIYSGDNYIPSYMNRTNNASINLTLSIKYDWK